MLILINREAIVTEVFLTASAEVATRLGIPYSWVETRLLATADRKGFVPEIMVSAPPDGAELFPEALVFADEKAAAEVCRDVGARALAMLAKRMTEMFGS